MAMMDTGNGVRDIIYVPIGQTEEAVALPVDDLPRRPRQPCSSSCSRSSRRSTSGSTIAKAYLQQGKEDNFHAILDNATADGAST